MPTTGKIHAVAARGPRPSGLAPVPDLRWGDHISAFFGTPDDLAEIVSDFFSAGLEAGEKCFWAASAPFTVPEAIARLRELIPDVDAQVARGALEVVGGDDWYLTKGEVDFRRVTKGWHAKEQAARRDGFEGLRIAGNAFWLQNRFWTSFSEYEGQLSAAIANANMIVLCIYPLDVATASDVLDITKAHDFSIVLRNGRWQFMESPDQVMARRQIDRLTVALDILSLPFPGREKLTPRERITLAQIIRGASNKEAARALEISPRTVEFHRANIMRKLGARNLAELMAVVLRAADGREEESAGRA
jgi:DNA-binding CsgD family transcriptional regulator